MVILMPLAFRSRDITAKSAFFNNLNTLTILHSAGYLGITLYIMWRVPLPAYFFKNYLFIDSLGIYEVLLGSRDPALAQERLGKDKKTPGKAGQRSCSWMSMG